VAVAGEFPFHHELFEQPDELGTALALGGKPVVAPVHRYRGGHRGVGFFEARLELRVVGGQRRQRGQVPTGGAAGDRDELGVAAIARDVLLDPGQGPLDVDDVIGPGVHRGNPIADRHAHPAAGGQVAHQRVGLGPAHSDHPAATGNLQQHRRLGVGRQVAAAPDVGQVRPPVGAIGHDVRLLDVAPARHRVAQRQAAPPAAGGLRRWQLAERLGVVLPQLFAQAGLQHRAGRGDTAVADHPQDGPGRCCQRQRRLSARPGEVATAPAP
jgi:hypothetical protein